jgi:hypothetical protein
MGQKGCVDPEKRIRSLDMVKAYENLEELEKDNWNPANTRGATYHCSLPTTQMTALGRLKRRMKDRTHPLVIHLPFLGVLLQFAEKAHPSSKSNISK